MAPDTGGRRVARPGAHSRAARPVARWSRRAAALVVGASALAACGSTTSAPSTTSTAPPRPIRAADCPGRSPVTLGAVTPSVPPRDGLAAALVPPTPLVGTVCRYSGVGAGGAGSTLEHAKVVTGPGLRALVALLDSPRWSVVAPSAVYSCPNWDGAADVGLFVYAIGPSVRVTVDLGGCGFASNGVRTVQGTGIAGQLAASVGS